MLELEVWGLLSKGEFQSKLKVFSKKFGKPKLQKRLSFECNNYLNKELDTRIKITNGKAHLVQKVGVWNKGGAWKRKELDIDIPDDAQNILQTFKVLKNIVLMYAEGKYKKNIEFVLQQFKNYLFETDDFEIKLTYQFGAGDYYLFELEAKKKGVDIIKVCKDLGLKPDLEPRDNDYWQEWNKKVNLDMLKMTDEDILEIIKKYLRRREIPNKKRTKLF